MNKSPNIVSSIRLQNLLPYLWARAALRFFPIRYSSKKSSIVINKNTIELDLADLEQKYLLVDCIREPENLLVYRAIAKAQLVDTYIDIGANCGHVSLSIINDYKKIILFEPNPKLVKLLKIIFKSDLHVKLKPCAVVDKANVGYLQLNVPKSSSGLATLGNFLVQDSSDFSSYKVKANTLEAEVLMKDLKNAYIKIDVEGLEDKVISSMMSVIKKQRPIIGFEALSSKLASQCINKFDDYFFYCARFNFIENGGALSKSFLGIIRAFIVGGNIQVIKLNATKDLSLNNFSQIYSVPKEKSKFFEVAIRKSFKQLGVCDLTKLKTWKKSK